MKPVLRNLLPMVGALMTLATEASVGAEPAAWWSLQKPVRPRIPVVQDTGWARTPVDAFILAALGAKGMRPAPEAERATLIRRITYDLLGLPPTPEYVGAFVGDPDPQAYDKLIDR